MSNIVSEISIFRSGSVNDQSPGETCIPVDRDHLRECDRAPVSTMAPECPVLTQAGRVNRLCNRRGVFLAGQSGPTVR